MGFFNSLLRFFGQATTFAPWSHIDPVQHPLALNSVAPVKPDNLNVLGTPDPPDDQSTWPVGKPFDGCVYPHMTNRGWKSSNTNLFRENWLENSNGWSRYDIHSDFDYEWPQGIVRKFEIEITNQTISPDGYKKSEGKVMNKQYPGPLIEACWGDLLVIKVTNNLPTNGTTIHWHGVRQLNSNQMDGVNGVTQCPIAQNSSFEYKFRATQYGHTWYHSHYSLQYPDGVLGPLILHGPQSANWDVELPSLFVSDWSHNSAFADFSHELTAGPPEMQSILLGGVGNYTNCSPTVDRNCTGHGSRFELVVVEYKKYLIRLVNTATATTFIFSIDRHRFKVISTDFVPIKPYETEALAIGIGQRYSIILEANAQDKYPFTPGQNFWIRTIPAEGCGNINTNQTTDAHLKTGVIRYGQGPFSNITNTDDPVSTPWDFSTACEDEPYHKLVPVVPWHIAHHPANNVTENSYDADLTKTPITYHGNVNRWDLASAPMWLDFEKPTILHLNQTTFDGNYTVVDYNYQDEWVYLVVTGTPLRDGPPNKLGIAAAHPIHLHGHDFGILAQGSEPYDNIETPKTFKYNNPPRRDVALLPKGGYLALAFKSDNPGSWLLHCHIAWHASSGLALQILERQGDIPAAIGPLAFTRAQTTCDEWNAWRNKQGKDWTATHQDDSGI